MAQGGEWVRQNVKPPATLRGEIRLPGDKSISHRAAILNGIARGSATVANFAQSDDCLATVACLQALGVDIECDESGTLRVRGVGGGGLCEPGDVLNARNSGTTMRMLSGLLAGQHFLSVITGDGSLRCRPMDRVVQPLRLMGAGIWGRGDDSRAPLVIRGGQLNGIRYQLPVPSAQVKSAILIAGLFADGSTVVREPVRSRDHTERLLRAMGAEIEINGESIILSPRPLKAVDLQVPGDISSAAFWLVAGAVHGDARLELPHTGMNPTRSGIVDILRSMGADLVVRNERVLHGEPVADLEVGSSALRGTEVGGALVPRLIDEIPVVALAACFARGKTVIRDAAELRVKETDRIRLTVKELGKMGAEVEELADGMIIHGVRRLRGAHLDSHGDHRLAMMLAVGALLAEGESEIDNAEAADISYATFWRDLRRASSD